MTCTICHNELDKLAAFPGNICLDCYKKTPDATAPITMDELASMFRRSVR